MNKSAIAVKAAIPDSAERERIEKDLDASFFVEAGAGSGKTKSLVLRMVALIAQGKARIENIYAITFTRKAAAQLKERFQIYMEAALHDEKSLSPEAAANIRQAIENLERAFTGTIHSFCARLLRERPVEADIDPNFEEIEEEDDDVYAEKVWNEFLSRKGINDPRMVHLRKCGIRPDDLKQVYLNLHRYPDVEIFRKNVAKPSLDRARKAVKAKVDDIRREMPRERPEDAWDDLQKKILQMRNLIKSGYLDEDYKFIHLLEQLNKNIKATQNRWKDKETAKLCESDMRDFQEKTVFPILQEWKMYLHESVIDFTMEGVKYYEMWRTQRGIVNFQDLLMKTAKLLRENPEVRQYFKNRITRLLVDEFQDTDPIQAEIIMFLTGRDNAEKNWWRLKPAPGSLFIVGDPKQSIYRFRRADVNIYNGVKRIFEKGGGEVLNLTANFRSLRQIGDFTDSVFKDKFGSGDRYQSKFAPLNTVRQQSSGDMYSLRVPRTPCIFTHEIDPVKGNPPKIVAELDARSIAAWIKHAVSGHLKLQRTDEELKSGLTEKAVYSDFMILTRGKPVLPIYARALEEEGIPYEVSGGEDLAKTLELREMLKVLKAVSDPGDKVSLLAALRGMFFGISDQDLYEFRESGGKFSFFTEAHGKHFSLLNAFKKLNEYYELSRKYKPPVAAELIIERLAVIPLAASGEMGSTRAGNILKTLEVVAGPGPDGIGSFSEFIENIEALLEGKSEGASLFPMTSKVVRLMNLHKAKGLEAPVVILGQPLDPSKDHPPQIHVTHSEDTSVGYFAASKSKGEFQSTTIAVPPDWDEKSDEERKYESAEEIRLKYVAVTRAKDILVVSTYHQGTKKKTWEDLYPQLKEAQGLSLFAGEPLASGKGSGDMYSLRVPRTPFKITPSEFSRELKGIESRIQHINRQTYSVETITHLAKEEDLKGAYGKGPAWGRLVHRALEACGRGKRNKLNVLASSWLAEEGIPESERDRLLTTVDRITKSEIWKRMLKSEEKYFEVPFSISREGTVYSGAIDLIFKETGGWVIVDYKTDEYEKDPKRKHAYEKQLKMYADFWQQMTGQTVREAVIWKV